MQCCTACRCDPALHARLGGGEVFRRLQEADADLRTLDEEAKSSDKKKNAAHAARQALARGRKIHALVRDEARLSDQDRALLDDFISGKLARDRDERDAAFGWNREMRTAAGSAAISMGR